MFKKTLALLASVGLTSAAPQSERVPSIPGYPDITNFEMYSGYIGLKNTTKAIHYAFLTSQGDKVNDPLVIWFNGGPGCSSMLAWAQEHGPFLQSNTNQTFYPNDHAWNKFANMLYIEQPAGVGFSYCDHQNAEEDCTHSDNTIGADMLETILGWYEKYPEFKKNDLFISGESYGGIYVPYTTYAVYHHNQAMKATGGFQIKLQGFMVGNGVTNWKYDTTNAFVKMAYWHSLYDDKMNSELKENKCDFWGVEFDVNPSPKCLDLLTKFEEKYVDKVNIYNIYGYCYGLPTEDGSHLNFASPNEMGFTTVGGQIKTYKKAFSSKDYTPWAHHANYKTGLKETPPCVNGQYIIDFLNKAEVRQALHIPDNYPGWDMCNSQSWWKYEVLQIGSQWIYESLVGTGIRMLHFSGDVDGAVPTDGTYDWIQSMKPTIIEPYRPYMVNGHVAGYVEEYEGLTFATVHGAGHMVPEDKPPEAYYMITNWMRGNKL